MRVFARLAALLRPHAGTVIGGILLSVLALAANVGLLALSSWFIASMAVAGVLGVAMEYSAPGAAVRGLALLRAGGRYAERLVNHDTTLRILSTLRVWFFRRLEPLAPAGLARLASGDLLSRIRSDVDTLDDFYVRGVVPVAAAVLALGAFLPFLAHFDARLAAVDAAGLVSGGVLLPLVLQRLAAAPGRRRVALSAELRGRVVEEAQGMAELVALGAIGAHAAAMDNADRALARTQQRLASLQAAGESGLAAAASLALWGAVLLLLPAVGSGALAGADLPMLAVFVLASFEAVMPLPAVIQRAGEMAAAARRLFDLVDTPPAVREPPGGSPPLPADLPIAAGLSLRGVTLRYEAGAAPVLRGFSMEAPAGRCVAVVGATGAGKSSLLNVLLRFWEYSEGEILVSLPGRASVELRSVASDQARRLFTVMPQVPHLFHASLRENLLLAAPEGVDLPDTVLEDALRAACLGDLLSALPSGLDTLVGESGRELSMGEARRVALARLFLRQAPMVILDEPTESLDAVTAAAVISSVRERLRGRTILLVTHRESDLVLADAVVRLPAPG
jgi:ATP-binding cassette, subfamily C, bacterial CydC